ncbi:MULTISPECIES: tyrosine-protein phosphatase [unclassified Crossiella]|uniref:tyrosine-protein phosphatase n=1 Tax=unclassified Crossiella TaxID=2620835 RepID=UPI00200031E7|nr:MULTISPECIES: tyrosine-protein phosphatase [unclassified Crossiella]MCK2240387.1 tyrosine-protein phosphatase [Crossiella sp. S99.2]MCK2253161.1 tyrosine-protein phosphatase [Crossiella sp. S99.1]
MTTGLVNGRDLGGLRTADGRLTRHGVLLRSEAPLAGDTVPELAGWPPAVVLDLRGSKEGHAEHPLLVNGTVVHRIPMLDLIMAAAAADPAAIDLGKLYLQLLAESAAGLVEVVRLASAADGAVLVHCSVGKDRTGVSVALLLRVAGVPRETVIADYVRTETNMSGVIRRVATSLGRPEPTDDQLAAMRHLLAAPAAAIVGVLDALDAHEGGPRGWLLANGATEQEIDRWITRILAD